MRICLIASSRFPIREPFAGGLESMTWTTARGLAERGHDVTLFAGRGSDTSLPVRFLPLSTLEVSAAAMADKFAPGPGWLAEHHAYLALMLSLARTGAEEYDVVHNNSLHHLPIAMAPAVDVPMLTTLHTPPLPMIESALALCPRPPRFVAVSEWTANAWRHAVDSDVVLNGLDLRDWPAGPGGGPGRVVGPDRAGEGAAPGDRGLPDRGRAARARRPPAGPGLLRPTRWLRSWATTPTTPATSPSVSCRPSCGRRRWRW